MRDTCKNCSREQSSPDKIDREDFTKEVAGTVLKDLQYFSRLAREAVRALQEKPSDTWLLCDIWECCGFASPWHSFHSYAWYHSFLHHLKCCISFLRQYFNTLSLFSQVRWNSRECVNKSKSLKFESTKLYN